MKSDEVLALARDRFVSGERLEMGELAAHAGVNRSTVYRRFNGRDGLLGEVIWSLTEMTMDAAARRAQGQGGVRVASMMREFAVRANGAQYFRDFFAREPERAWRLMTTKAGGVQPRIVDRVETFIDGEVLAGTLVPPLPVPDLALILVRITETFVYANAISGEEPDAEKVAQACGAMLGVRDAVIG
ncbi:TetR family transcriptional regulator [Gordonia sp. HY002]|uniref:QsdR family transcriptional regulator n=1 Tax=Gordonia zhenghanii TaxID=2911516 RepID=UPI001EEF3D78|nr:QsdR family transcriptional regulator [Gordonia zhenghanii]MCF8571226.1 TetR family transcriptional regulator [Gordonia zhenghanii]MCF8601750.1 TetR family transcriptional regulator [Gordonia zhenghanii]